MLEQKNSILTSVKKMLGIAEEYEQFDLDILIHINSVFTTLNQLGVGPEEGYSIESSANSWNEFLGSESRLAMVKSYMYLKVRFLFDPPTIGGLIDATERQIAEMEWRITNAFKD